MTLDTNYFDTAEELAVEARKSTTKAGSGTDVERTLGYPPPYDEIDLLDYLKEIGYSPRLNEQSTTRMFELIANARPKFPLLPLEDDVAFGLTKSVDDFLADLGGLGEENAEAQDIVYSVLDVLADQRLALNRIIADLSRRFSGWRPVRAEDQLAKSLSSIYEASNVVSEIWPKYQECWVESLRITNKVINRSTKGRRWIRRQYVAERIFDHLCYGLPLTEHDLKKSSSMLAYFTRERKVMNRALGAALETTPRPQSFGALVRAAHKLLGGSGSSHAPDYEAFRRQAYRYVPLKRRKWLISGQRKT